jgi:signal peptidase I
MDKEKKQKAKNFLEFCIYAVFALAITYFVLMFVGQRTSVIGTSMYPTLDNDDQLIMDKISYRFGEPKRFDIVVFNQEDAGEEVHYIKRVIGLPGETVHISDGKIYIDDKVLEENYGYYVGGQTMNGYDFSEPTLIEPDEYFVLGDNRNDSLDSRKIGCINKKDIIGKAVFRLFPLSSIGTLE